MEIGLIDGIEPHQQDENILKALKAAKRKLGGSRDIVIAFMNEGGEIYRRAILNGIHQELYLDERLEALGLVNRTMQGERKRRGVSSVFGPALDLSKEAVLAKLLKDGEGHVSTPESH